MGWTSYDRGWTPIKDCAMEVVNEIANNGNILHKTVYKAKTMYALYYSTKASKMWVLKLLVDKERSGIFYYKDIQANPYETEDIPKPILKLFQPTTDEDKEWKEKCLNWWKGKEAKKKIEPKIGDFIKCKALADISWPDGKTLKGGEEFTARVVDRSKMFSKRVVKSFLLCDSEGRISHYALDRKLFDIT